MYVTVLTGTAGLLLMLTLYIGGTLDGFSVRDLLRYHIDADTVFGFQFAERDVQLAFALTADQRLPCFFVSDQRQRRILFDQSRKACGKLVVRTLIRGFDRHEQGRLREALFR